MSSRVLHTGCIKQVTVDVAQPVIFIQNKKQLFDRLGLPNFVAPRSADAFEWQKVI